MTLKIRHLFLLSLLTICLAPALAEDKEPSNDIDWKKGEWGDLAKYIGTYEYDAVIKDKRVTAALNKLMSEKDIKTLNDNMDVRNSIGFEEDCLQLSGNVSKAADKETAFTSVCLYKGGVHAAIKHEGKITLYSSAEKYEYLPYGMRVWLYGQKNGAALDEMPDGVEFVLAPQ